MKCLFATLLALAVAGCADRGNVGQETPIKLVEPSGHILSPTKSVSRKSLTARADVTETHARENANKSSLMECVSDACKTQCVSGIEKQSRPKWCMYFKEPTDARLSATAQSKSTE